MYLVMYESNMFLSDLNIHMLMIYAIEQVIIVNMDHKFDGFSGRSIVAIIPIMPAAINDGVMFAIIILGDIFTIKYMIAKFTNTNSSLTIDRVIYIVVQSYLIAIIIAGQRTIMCNNWASTDSLGFPIERYTSLQ